MIMFVIHAIGRADIEINKWLQFLRGLLRHISKIFRVCQEIRGVEFELELAERRIEF
jgi:hypothetical protein